MGERIMATKGGKQGSIETKRGKLYLRIWWHHPEDQTRDYRWRISTGQENTPQNRQTLEIRLITLKAKIDNHAFFPCTEFPGTKIAAYCRCPNCAIVEPLDKSHQSPLTFGELLEPFKMQQQARATGPKRKVEWNTWATKRKHINAFSTEPYVDRGDPENLDVERALTAYQINELTPAAVQEWLGWYQHRAQLEMDGKDYATTKYMNQLGGIVKEALRYGQLQRWWRTHPLLEYEGQLMEATKDEKNRIKNKTMNKPFSLVERDKIIQWYYDQWQACDEKAYNGREKPRLMFHYFYVLIGFNPGMRSPSELTALRWTHIDFSRNQIYVAASRESTRSVNDQRVREYTKTIKHRYVPMNDVVVQAFRDLREVQPEDAEDWIFWNPMASFKNSNRAPNGWAPIADEKRVRGQFNKCLKALGIPNPKSSGQYRMRHTFVITVLDNTDLSDSEVAAMIGDTVETMKRNYEGHCRNRWHNPNSREKLNAINEIGKQKLRVVEK
jgi:integrase